MRARQLLLVSLFSGVLGSARAADVEIRLEPPFVWAGDAAELFVTIVNPPRGLGVPRLPEVPGLSIEGPGGPSQRNEVVSGGARGFSSRVSLEYHYRLTPGQNSGKYALGPVVIPVPGGKELRSQAIELNVFKKPRPGVRFQCEISPPQSAVGSPTQVVYTAFYGQTLEGYGVDLPVLQLSQAKVTPVVIDASRETKRTRLRQGPWFYEERGFAEIDGYGYFTMTFGFEVVPMVTGRLELPPATIQVRLRTGRVQRRRGFSVFGSGIVHETKDHTARTEAKAVIVRELPQENRPTTFNGAIGNFTFAVKASPTEVDAFAPIALEMTLSGVGNIEKAPPPPLTKLPELTANFDVATDVDSGRLDERKREKVFRQVIRPRDETVTEIPRIPFAFYDPRVGDYRITYSDPIKIQVRAVKTVGGADAIPSALSGPQKTASRGSGADTGPAIPLIEQAGIGANYSDPGTILPALDPRAELVRPGFLVTLLGPPLFLAVLLFVRRAARRDPERLTKQRALRRAHGRLRASPDSLDSEAVSQAFQDYFRDRLSLGHGELTPHDVARVLNDQGVEGPLRDQVTGLLERLLAGRFSGTQASPGQLAKEAMKTLGEVERCVE